LVLVAINKSTSFTSNPVTRYRIHDQSVSISEEAILSYQSFSYWTKNSTLFNAKLKKSILNYINIQIYKWGRHQALIGNKEKSTIAETLLEQIAPNIKWKLFFLIINFKPIKWAASFRRYLLIK